MGEKSKIQWTEATWNPVVGCTRVSAGCDHCYAVTMTRRLEAMGMKDYAGLANSRHFDGKVRCLPHVLDKPLRWKKPRRIFVNSMSDLFHPGVPFEFVDKVVDTMIQCPRHSFQVLTKRPERMAEYLHSRHAALVNYPAFIWLGTSVEDQAAADERIPKLLRCPAAVRFLSCEPLLGPVDLQEWMNPARQVFEGLNASPRIIHWVIVGCESGPRRRECNPDWIRSIVDQCESAGVACFVKQFPLLRHRKGTPSPHKVSHDPDEWPEWARVRQFPEAANACSQEMIRRAEFKTHPDHGGSAHAFKMVQAARAKIKG